MGMGRRAAGVVKFELTGRAKPQLFVLSLGSDLHRIRRASNCQQAAARVRQRSLKKVCARRGLWLLRSFAIRAGRPDVTIQQRNPLAAISESNFEFAVALSPPQL